MASSPLAEFGVPGPLRDALVGAILSGSKTSTSSLVEQHTVQGASLPKVGDRSAVVDSAGQVVCEIQTTRVGVVPLGAVDLGHARAEGEGFQTVLQWREAHQNFWGSPEMRAELGTEFVLDEVSPPWSWNRSN